MSTPPKPHKSRLSSLFGGRNDNRAPPGGAQDSAPTMRPDSHYNSDNNSNDGTSTTAAPSFTSQAPSDRYKTITTTTTTTTTTTNGPHSSNTANKLDPRVDSTSVESTSPGYGANNGSTTTAPQNSNLGNQAQSRMDGDYRSTTTAPHNSNLGNQAHSRMDGDYGPSVPERSALRTPDRPDRNASSSPNFSYPHPAPTSRGPGTIQNLKVAAAGIHVRTILQNLKFCLLIIHQGAGETLRGALNSSVDRRFHAPPDTVAKHDEVAASGRSEIESGRFSDTTRAREDEHTPGRLRRKLRVINE